MIYLDSAATTPIAKDVLDAMMPWLRDNYCNAGSVYRKGREAKRAIENARAQVAKMFNASPENIIFTSGGSESNSFAFQAAAERLEGTNRKHILVSSIEHDSVLRAAEALTKRGFYVDYLPVSECGSVLYETVKNAITPETGLISIMLMNNETGVINHLDFIARLCQEQGILLHSDCVQAAGVWKINIEDTPFDFASISAHKFFGPKGVGCVYIKDPEECCPMIYGGNSQEFGIRGGTENVAGIVGMGVAAEAAINSLDYVQETIWNHRYLFWNIVNEHLGSAVRINGQWPALSKVLNIRIEGVDADTFVMAMDTAGVCLSAGSACRSLELEPSHVLLSMGLTPDEARSSVRISFSGAESDEDIQDAANIFADTVKTLRGDAYDS